MTLMFVALLDLHIQACAFSITHSLIHDMYRNMLRTTRVGVNTSIRMLLRFLYDVTVAFPPVTR